MFDWPTAAVIMTMIVSGVGLVYKFFPSRNGNGMTRTDVVRIEEQLKSDRRREDERNVRNRETNGFKMWEGSMKPNKWPTVIDMPDGTILYSALMRLVPCDDGVKRYEVIGDDELLRLSEDEGRNVFTVAYLSKKALENVGLKLETGG